MVEKAAEDGLFDIRKKVLTRSKSILAGIRIINESGRCPRGSLTQR